MADLTSKSATPDADGKVTYHGNCHCGAFKYSVKTFPLKTKDMTAEEAEKSTAVAQCNCSVCTKKGYMWIFPQPETWTIEKGTVEETLKTYTWNTGTTYHRFCGNCGTGVMGFRPQAPPGQDVGINIRTLFNSDVDPDNLDLTYFKGYEVLKPEYQPPPFPDHGLQISEEEKAQGVQIYTGSCHCGKVKVALKSKAFESGEADLKNDDCSICARNALTLTYPTPYKELVAYSGEENLQTYFFGRKFNGHRFCKDCGVQVDIDVIGPPGIRERLPQLPQAQREMIEKNLNTRPINIRNLDDWVLKGGEKGWGLENFIKKSRGEATDYVV